ncbi:DinB family protein [Mycobacteroides abscessus]|uniref:DinB family protein n=1 Tax=Mycobacteroides abscessus TaxID=36809 RepID=UPI0009A666AA|nr:DinB family protein [Mycobacteroides abscessus]SLI52977.1 Mini-circle protein [Mycobacteroides abscessus subsp. abscessus]SLJ11812.1 Mini-circle protein [Mycobacteroides abscessus subsp. abscessus]SLJ81001.1 Mini-circle protein [Mycobacteroides abscessus subsp. abscessus]
MTAALDPGRPFTGNERELLENTLELNRDEIVRAVEQLSDSQARRKLVPSLTTPISLIKHCATAERIWFQRTLAGMAAEDCDGYAETGGDPSFHVDDDETLADVLGEYAAARAKSNAIAARYQLDYTAQHRLVGTVSLRFIYLGMIAELARHAGHADILAEQIQASTIDMHP